MNSQGTSQINIFHFFKYIIGTFQSNTVAIIEIQLTIAVWETHCNFLFYSLHERIPVFLGSKHISQFNQGYIYI